MARRRLQYSPVYRRLANENKLKTAMPRKHLLVGASYRKPGLDHKFLKIRFVSNSSNRIVFLQGQLPCWKLLIYLQGSSCHFESMASMENTIPLGYLNMKALQWYLETLLISSVSGYPILGFFGSGIIFSGGPIV